MESVLFVCTGNICRSAMAEALVASMLRQRGAGVSVTSAGLLSPDRCSTDEAVAVMRRRRLDLSAHRSRRLATALEDDPDLVVAMAGEHLRAVVDLRPDYLERTFLLTDFVRRAQRTEGRRAGETVADYLRRLPHDGGPAGPAGHTPGGDVADPIGCSERFYEQVAAEIERLVGALVDAVWPAGSPAGTPPS